jgi:hypothetical protein
LLASELEKLKAIRHRTEECPDGIEARALIAEAEDLLCSAEQDAAADLLDAEGILSGLFTESAGARCNIACTEDLTRRPDIDPTAWSALRTARLAPGDPYRTRNSLS